MDKFQDLAGVVLAGGRSSRMGQNKALLDYRGVPLIEHMCNILKKAGIANTYISGEVKGYDCIKDTHLFAGPAKAIKSSMNILTDHTKFLFLPVDMPLLNFEVINPLLQGERGGYYEGWPLPACIKRSNFTSYATSVKGLLKDYDVPSLTLPVGFCASMKNTNTPQEWEEVIAR